MISYRIENYGAIFLTFGGLGGGDFEKKKLQINML